MRDFVVAQKCKSMMSIISVTTLNMGYEESEKLSPKLKKRNVASKTCLRFDRHIDRLTLVFLGLLLRQKPNN